MDIKKPLRRSLSRVAENGNVTTITVQEPDQYTGMAVLEITTQVFDHYTSAPLAPRTSQFFMSKKQIQDIGKFLIDA